MGRLTIRVGNNGFLFTQNNQKSYQTTKNNDTVVRWTTMNLKPKLTNIIINGQPKVVMMDSQKLQPAGCPWDNHLFLSKI